MDVACFVMVVLLFYVLGLHASHILTFWLTLEAKGGTIKDYKGLVEAPLAFWGAYRLPRPLQDRVRRDHFHVSGTYDIIILNHLQRSAISSEPLKEGKVGHAC